MFMKWKLCVVTVFIMMALYLMVMPAFSETPPWAIIHKNGRELVALDYEKTGPLEYRVVFNRSELPKFSGVKVIPIYGLYRLELSFNSSYTSSEYYKSLKTDANNSLTIHIHPDGKAVTVMTILMDENDEEAVAYAVNPLISPEEAINSSSPSSSNSPSALPSPAVSSSPTPVPMPSISLPAGISSTPTPTPSASSRPINKQFADVPQAHWAYEPVTEMIRRGPIDGYADGLFYPDKIVTRAELAKIMVLAAGLKEQPVTTSSFADVLQGDWHAPYVEAAKPYLAGFSSADGSISFAPDSPALREDMTMAVVKLKGYEASSLEDNSLLQTRFSDEDDISTTAKKYVVLAVKNDMISGYPDGTFHPQEPVTRAQAAAILTRAFGKAN